MAQIPCYKPFDLKKKIKRFVLTEHIVWTEEQWNMVHFSDEFKFNLFGFDGKKFVKCKNGELLSPQYIKKTVKFGVGSLMVWGMIFSVGVGPIVFMVILMPVFIKNFFASILFLIYTKGQLKLQ